MRLQQAIINLIDELMAAGFGRFLQPPGPITWIAEPLKDSKTKGMIAHVEEPLSAYIQRVSIAENFMQRPPFDHARTLLPGPTWRLGA